MQNVAHSCDQIIERLAQYQNGEVSVAMKKLGLNYKVNYGLSVLTIDKLAKTYKNNNELAICLWNKDIREAKLLALRLFELVLLSLEQINLIAEGISNIELAEQTSLHVLIKLSTSNDIAKTLLNSKNEFQQLAGFITISKIAQITKNAGNELFTNYLELFSEIKSDYHSLHLKRGLSRALLQIGLRNNQLQIEVKAWIEKLKENSQDLKDWLNQEVSYYLQT